MGEVYYATTDIGDFTPDTEGTTGDVYHGAVDIGDFELAASGLVYYGATQIGTYAATGEEYPPGLAADARYNTKVYLESYIDPSHVTKDDGTTEAPYAIIYAYPNYPLIREFDAATNPVDLLFLIGKPNSTVLLQADQSPWGYEEHVPITVACVDKTGVSGTRLLWKGERELRIIAEEHPEGSQRSLERTGDRDQRLGSTIIYMTDFILNYRRDTT